MSTIAIRAYGTKLQRGVAGASIDAPVFVGSGLNDATSSGTYTGNSVPDPYYTVIIDATGTPDTFKWSKNGGSFTTGVAITGSAQTLADGVQIHFAATTGHTLGAEWVIRASTDTFTTIAEVKTLTWKMSAKQNDVTTHSTGQNAREFITSLIDFGTVTFGVNFVPTEGTQDFAAGVLGDFVAGVTKDYRWVFPDPTRTPWRFRANVQDFAVDGPVDGEVGAPITFKVTGLPAFI